MAGSEVGVATEQLRRCSLNEVDAAVTSLLALAPSCSDEEVASVASAINNRLVWSDRRTNGTLAKLTRQLSGDIRFVEAFLTLVEVTPLEAVSYVTVLHCMNSGAS